MTDEELFHLAREMPEPERAVLLDEACSGDPAQRQRVEALLRSHETPDSFLAGHAPGASRIANDGSNLTDTCRMGDEQADADRRHGEPEPPVSQIGPYRLLQQIGEGGMGTVYMAEQVQPVRRRVALKVIKPGMDSRQVIARFEAERQALALMDHVNIARVLDAGTTETGRPYFVMELVQGVPITRYCDDNQLTPRKRLELFVPVCQAVQHAHQKGIIHRDIKPSNVMVTMYDGRPVPKVIDFGVAKAIDQNLTERTLFTQFGTMIGTLEYMSPEQAEMSALGVDTRSDIYSLGVLLYELLTGSTPLTRERMRQAAYGEIVRLIKEEEPARPSTRISESGADLAAISACRHTEPARLTKLLQGEIDWIVLRSLEKDRERRYVTANAFAADLQNYLSDEPVAACPPTRRYRLRKFIRRHRVPMMAASAFALLLLAGIVGTAWQAWRATVAERLSSQNEKRAIAQEATARANFELAREAVETYLDAVTEDPKLKSRDLFELRRDLLRTAVPFYLKVAGQSSDDPGLEASRGMALHRLALVRDELGEKVAALADYQAMQAVFEKLAAAHPNEPVYREKLGASHNNRGNSLLRLGRHVEAEAAYRKGLRLKQALADEFPRNVAYRQNFARTAKGLGLLLMEMGRTAEAEATLRESIQLQRSILEESSGERDYRRDLGNTWNNLAILLKSAGRLSEAETSHIEAQKIYLKLIEDFPDDPVYRKDLATSHSNMANALSDLGRNAEAEAAQLEAIRIREGLAATFASVPEHRENLGVSYHNRGVFLDHQKRPAEAHAASREAIRIRERLAADFPAVGHYTVELANSEKLAAIVANGNGEPQAALTYADKAIERLEPVVAKQPQNAAARTLLRELHTIKARRLEDLGRAEEAVPHRDRAAQLKEGAGMPEPR